MTINQRKKGHDFERKIAKKLQEDLDLIKPVRRILNSNRLVGPGLRC